MNTRSLFLLLLVMLSACTVGPDYKRPGLETEAGYQANEPTTVGERVAVGEQQLTYGADVPGRWWELLQNPKLDALIQQAIEANPDLASARATLRQYQELALAEAGGQSPSLSVSGSTERGREGDTGIYNLSSASLDLSIDLDAAGGNRRAVEAARAAAESQAFEAEAAYLTLTADLTSAVIEEASLREQITATEEIVASSQELLKLLQLQVEVGIASASSLLQQQATLKQTQASLPGLIKNWEQQRNAIAVLAGEFPNNYDVDPFTLDSLALPHELPVSLPAALVRQRPDVRSSEALVHQASANIGVAAAERLPQISLTASIGSSASSLSNLFNPGTLFASVAAGVSQTLLDGGSLTHNQRAAEAAFDAALANYRSVVLSAFKDVADALRAVQRDSESLTAYSEAEQAARDSLDLASLEFRVGTGDYTDVLSAQQTYAEARINRAGAVADRYLDAVLLFEALGGGWWNRPDNLIEPAYRQTSPTSRGTSP